MGVQIHAEAGDAAAAQGERGLLVTDLLAATNASIVKPMKISISLLDSASTDALGAQLVAALPPCPNAWMILLQGELGAGKSTLARAMLRSMGHAGAVPESDIHSGRAIFVR